MSKDKSHPNWCSKHQTVHRKRNLYPSCTYPNDDEKFISDFCQNGLHAYCKMVGCECDCHKKNDSPIGFGAIPHEDSVKDCGLEIEDKEKLYALKKKEGDGN